MELGLCSVHNVSDLLFLTFSIWRLQKQETDLTLVLTSLERLAFAELKRTATEGKIDENNVAETVDG